VNLADDRSQRVQVLVTNDKRLFCADDRRRVGALIEQMGEHNGSSDILTWPRPAKDRCTARVSTKIRNRSWGGLRPKGRDDMRPEVGL
jgi:hypothetical protein